MNATRYFIVVVCAAAFGALASVTLPPSGFVLAYAPPAPSVQRELCEVASAEPAQQPSSH